MPLTPARTDLPKVGDTIAVLHGMGQWYSGPDRVMAVDETTRVVRLYPECWKDAGLTGIRPDQGSVQYTPDEECPYPLRWNYPADLQPGEMVEGKPWRPSWIE